MLRIALATAALALAAGCAQQAERGRIEGATGEEGPRYAVDPYWPKPLPNAWLVGQVAGIAVDRQDRVWVLHRPRTLTEDERGAALNPPRSKCCFPAPPVLVFDRAGNLLKSWGGPGAGYEWPANEHGIHVDALGNVWVGGNANTDHQILKFDENGRFLLQVGRSGASKGSNAPDQLGRPAHMEVDVAANELFIADGYQNRRIIVVDASTGAYKRHWGAFGNRPSDEKVPDYNPQSAQFGNPVHCVRQMRDGTLFVCDRANNRIQVFRKDGAFVRQIVLEADTRGSGSVWDLIAADDTTQRYLLVADGSNNQVYVMERETGRRVGAFGRNGRHAGDFHWVHNIAVDSRGTVYTAEVDTGKRAQKFDRVR
jgi:DNA-binding beta-propeller fold protein YncE